MYQFAFFVTVPPTFPASLEAIVPIDYLISIFHTFSYHYLYLEVYRVTTLDNKKVGEVDVNMEKAIRFDISHWILSRVVETIMTMMKLVGPPSLV